MRRFGGGIGSGSDITDGSSGAGGNSGGGGVHGGVICCPVAVAVGGRR